MHRKPSGAKDTGDSDTDTDTDSDSEASDDEVGNDGGITVEDGGTGREVLKGNEVCYVIGICICI